MKLVELGTGDAAAFAELEEVAFAHPWSEASLAAELAKEGARAVAVRDHQKLLAAALFASVCDEAELLRIATRPEARRQGLAQALLEKGLEQLREQGIGSVFLEVEAGNLPAVALYRSQGFVLSGRRPAYYPNGGDAELYRLDLAGRDGIPPQNLGPGR